MLIDCHAHLYLKEFNNDQHQVIQSAKNAGVSYILNAGIDIASSAKSIEISDNYSGMFASVGIHPHSAHKVAPGFIEELHVLASTPKVVAIGEIGLDYHWTTKHRPEQLKILNQQLELAQQLQLPVIIHCRNAEEEAVKTLESWVSSNPLPNHKWKGIRHCFSGDYDTAMRYIDMGFMLSFGGYIGYPSSRKLPQVICSLPHEALLIETDCPYMPPQKYRGKRNEPAYLVHTASTLAEIMGKTYEEIAGITIANAAELFNLDL